MVRIDGREWTRAALDERMGRLDALAGITPLHLVEGRADGVRALDVRTGAGLRFTTLADRCLDLPAFEFLGIPLCWHSSNDDAAPTYYDSCGDEWLRTFFGGMLTTAGLTNFGPGGTDRFGTVGLHGRINCTPAENVRWATRWDGDECWFEVEGSMRQTRVFGEDLELHRRIVTRLGSTSVHLHDAVTNHAATRSPHMILYHCNGGFPILGEAAQLLVSHSTFRPRDADAERGLENWDRGGPPHAGFKEQVFIHAPIRCADGRALVALINRELRGGDGLGVAIRFDPDELPALIQWRMLGVHTYVMGMEPANCPTIEGRAAAIERGTLPFLEPGECREYSLEFQVCASQSAIDDVEALAASANTGSAATERAPRPGAERTDGVRQT